MKFRGCLVAMMWMAPLGHSMAGEQLEDEIRTHFEKGYYQVVVDLVRREDAAHHNVSADSRCWAGWSARELGDIQLAASMMVKVSIGPDSTPPSEECLRVSRDLLEHYGQVQFSGEVKEAIWLVPIPHVAISTLEGHLTYQALIHDVFSRPWLLPLHVWLPVGEWRVGNHSFLVQGGETTQVILREVPPTSGPEAGEVLDEALRQNSRQVFEMQAPRPTSPRGWGARLAFAGGLSLDPLYLDEVDAPLRDTSVRLSVARELPSTHSAVALQLGMGVGEPLPSQSREGGEDTLAVGRWDLALLLGRRIQWGAWGLTPSLGLVTQPIQARVDAYMGCLPEDPTDLCVQSESPSGLTAWWWPGVGARLEVPIHWDSWRPGGSTGIFITPGVDLLTPLYVTPHPTELAPRLVSHPYVAVGAGWGW